MKRRLFISSLALSPLSAVAAGTVKQASSSTEPLKFLSPPVIQNPAKDSLSVCWMVNGLSTGWVEWGYSDKLGKITKPSHHGLDDLDDMSHSVRLSQLSPGKKIHYRLGISAINYKNAYSINRGPAIYSPTYEFELPDPKS